jgi:hypothetical protein
VIKAKVRSQPTSPASSTFPYPLEVTVEKTTTTISAPSPTKTQVERPRNIGFPEVAQVVVKMSDAASASSSSPAPLSFLVLLPSTTETRSLAPSHTISRPLTLQGRQSGSNVHTLKSLKASQPSEESGKAEEVGEAEIDKVVSAGRRLSLAPGIGAGTQTRTTPFQSQLSSLSSSPPLPASEQQSAPPPLIAKPPAFGAPAFGSSSRGPPIRGSSRKRPQTAATSALGPLPNLNGGIPRGSFAIPGQGMGMAGGIGRSKPGWEADEVVGVLRSGGLEGEL